MIYEAQNIDTNKALEFLNEASRESSRKEYIEKAKIEKYFEGFRDGIERARDMFYCKNYEKDAEKVEREDK